MNKTDLGNFSTVITGKSENIKRNVKHSFNPIIPSVLALEICLINKKTFIGLITIFGEATFVYTGKRWKDLIKKEHSEFFELFQNLYERRAA